MKVSRLVSWGSVIAFLLTATVFPGTGEFSQMAVRRDVAEFYAPRGGVAAWVDPEGHLTSSAARVLEELRAASGDGLDPDDYRASALSREAVAMEQTAGASPSDVAAFDAALTTSVLRYMRELHLGRVDPRAARFHLDHADQPHDFPGMLRAAMADGSLERMFADLRPPFVLYAGLLQQLREYRGRDPARARRIELAMERLRWLPDLDGRAVILVNIPMFRVWAWDADSTGGAPALDMAAIIGRARATRTPIFASAVTEVVLNPWWYVPDSIARREILPAVERDPTYLARHHMEVATEGGGVRISQRPGPWNALGPLKFVLPNDYGVYLHGTPALALFRQSRRDFSHGCVRVEEPVALAEWVLGAQSGWDDAHIRASIARGGTRSIAVEQPPEIVMFYVTAAFVPAEGRVVFADDIYGYDAVLDGALRRRQESQGPPAGADIPRPSAK